MERKKRLSKRTASVRIEPYLAEYIQKKLEIEPETGGVKIPYTTDLYHVVWNCMAKPDSHHDVMQDCNLKIYLPSRRSKMDGHPGKDPPYFVTGQQFLVPATSPDKLDDYRKARIGAVK
jgi:hypothetical protein